MTAFDSPLNKDFSDLRLFWPPKCPMTDDDNDFHSDMLYFRALLNDIVELAVELRHANPLPKTLTDDLDAFTDQLASARNWWLTGKALCALEGR